MLLDNKYVEEVIVEIRANRIVSFADGTEADLLFFCIALKSIKLEESFTICPEYVV